VNEPVYFHQFMERAAAVGLQYLGEADLSVMVPGNFPPEIENVLQMLAQDKIHLEQYMDFLRNRMFRQTLLCHKQQKPNYSLRGELLMGFHVASPLRAVSAGPDIATAAAEKFEGRGGVTLNSTDPLTKAAVVYLSEMWPRAVPFAEVAAEARKRLQRTDAATLTADQQALGQTFLTFYASASTNMIELSLCPPRFAVTVSAKPTASPLARLQAKSKNAVTNLRHETVYLGDLEQQVLQRLDGTRDTAALVSELAPLIASGQVQVEGQPAREALAKAVEAQLQSFAGNALLVT